jgi:hypothetical protein
MLATYMYEQTHKTLTSNQKNKKTSHVPNIVVLTAKCTQTPTAYYWTGMVCHVVWIHNLSHCITFSCTKFGW